MEITKEVLKDFIKDITSNVKDKDNFVIWCWGYEDENGNVVSGALEAFDKAMKEELKKDEIISTRK